MDLTSAHLHFPAAISKNTFIILTQPDNNIGNNIGTDRGDLAVTDMKTDGALLPLDHLVSNKSIIWIHLKPSLI